MFKWSKCVRSRNGAVFECHLHTRRTFVRYVNGKYRLDIFHFEYWTAETSGIQIFPAFRSPLMYQMPPDNDFFNFARASSEKFGKHSQRFHFDEFLFYKIILYRSKLPDDSAHIVSVLSTEMNEGTIGAKDANTINEYLCWKVYFR